MLLHEKKKKKIKNKVLSNDGDLYKNLYYSYKDKYNKERTSLDTKNREKLHYKKLRLGDYSFEEEQEEQKEQEEQEEQEEQKRTRRTRRTRKNKNI